MEATRLILAMSNPNMKWLKVAVSGAGLVVLLSITTAAEEITARWIGTGNGNWSNPLNWSTGTVPTNDFDTVYNVVWDAHPVTVNVDVPVSISNFTWATSGTLTGNFGLHIEGDFDWSAGTLGPAAPTTVFGSATLHAVAPNYIELNSQHIDFWRPVTLSSALRLTSSSDWIYGIPVITTRGVFEVGPGGSFQATPGGLSPAVIFNLGFFDVPSDASPVLCQADVFNSGEFVIEQRTFNLNGHYTQSEGVTTLHGANLPLIPVAALYNSYDFGGGSLLGTGNIGAVGFSGRSELNGRFTFDRLTIVGDGLADSPIFGVDVGGRTTGAFSHYQVSDSLTMLCPLRVRLTNGFNTAVVESDTFEFLTVAPGCEVEMPVPPQTAPFLNVAYGARITSEDGFATFIVDRAAADSDSLVLRNFQPSPFLLDFAVNREILPYPSTATFRAPSIRHTLDRSATITASSLMRWEGGRLELSIVSGFIPSRDELLIQSQPDGPGRINQSGASLRYSGVEFASAQWLTGPGDPTLKCVFNANATSEAIQALLRLLGYQVSYIWANEFTDITARLPPRSMSLALTNGIGQGSKVDFGFQFPYITGIATLPGSLILHDRRSEERMITLGLFSNGERTPLPFTPTTVAIPPFCAVGALREAPGIHVIVSGLVEGGSECADSLAVSAGPFTVDVPVQVMFFLDDFECVFAFLAQWIEFSGDIPEASVARAAASPPPIQLSLATFWGLESLMQQAPEGRRLATLYREHGPEVVSLIATNDSTISQMVDLVVAFQPGIAALLAGRGEEHLISQSMIDDLNSMWTNLSLRASPALRSAMETERARLAGFQSFVNKPFNTAAAQLEVPPPEQPWITLSRPQYDRGYFRAEANSIAGWLLSLWRASGIGGTWQQVDTIRETNGATLRLTDTNAPGRQQLYQIRAVAAP
jgi:hypothetical protein